MTHTHKHTLFLRSVDDASSISSGEISDAVNEMSTDDNITTGSSLSETSSEQTHPGTYPSSMRPMPNVLVCGTALASRSLNMRGGPVDGGGFSRMTSGGGSHREQVCCFYPLFGEFGKYVYFGK